MSRVFLKKEGEDIKILRLKIQPLNTAFRAYRPEEFDSYGADFGKRLGTDEQRE